MKSSGISNDYYKLLGVDQSASPETIKAAYRKAAKDGKYRHPDRGGDAKRFKEIDDAYKTLSDPRKRRAYHNEHGMPPPEMAGDISAADPYLSQSKIVWTTDGVSLPEPVTVRLSNRGGSGGIAQFGPERLSGAFWTLQEDSECVMDGDDLYSFIVAPVNTDSMTPGKHRDELHLFVDNQIVSLTLTLMVAAPRPKPPPIAAPPTRTPPPTPVRSIPPRESTPIDTLIAVGLELATFMLVVLASLTPIGIIFAMFAAGDLKNPDFGVAVVGFCCSIGFWVGAAYTVASFLRLSGQAQGAVVTLCISVLVILRLA